MGFKVVKSASYKAKTEQSAKIVLHRKLRNAQPYDVVDEVSYNVPPPF